MRTIYLDNGATSFPKPEGVSRAMKDYMDNIGATINRSVYGSAQDAGLVTLQLRQRLKRARLLLSSTNHTIKEICSMCGFKSVESFYRVFRNESGITPAQFRRRHIALLQTDLVRLKSSVKIQENDI